MTVAYHKPLLGLLAKKELLSKSNFQVSFKFISLHFQREFRWIPQSLLSCMHIWVCACERVCDVNISQPEARVWFISDSMPVSLLFFLIWTLLGTHCIAFLFIQFLLIRVYSQTCQTHLKFTQYNIFSLVYYKKENLVQCCFQFKFWPTSIRPRTLS